MKANVPEFFVGTDISACTSRNVPPATASPTDEVSHDLQYAYRYFNNTLFGGTLPANIVLSYQRDSASFACYRERQYLHVSRRESHAIAVNPQYLALRTLTESLASLVHAMCKLAHGEYGRRKSRSSYHNRELAAVLKRVGLLRARGWPT
ncbi:MULTISPECIES: hypothetical protein [unclassified Dyella]|uniref:hypothetical protein n=1 Tax=Dyella sp. ASV21 TaxID=2795114 RepID=UPI0018EAE5E9|nr:MULTISPECIES: hypothetical protein [unclassified Dyella]